MGFLDKLCISSLKKKTDARFILATSIMSVWKENYVINLPVLFVEEPINAKQIL
jgi:hypothetical protein